MGRPPIVHERRQQYSVNLPPTFAEWLRAYGGGNLSAGVCLAVYHLTDIVSLYREGVDPPPPPPAANRFNHDQRRERADARMRSLQSGGAGPVVVVAPRNDDPPFRTVTEEELDRIRIATRERAKALSRGYAEARSEIEQREFESLVDEYFGQSVDAFKSGQPLPAHEGLMYTNRRAWSQVMARCNTAFGWQQGPMPPELVKKAAAELFAPDPPPVRKAPPSAETSPLTPEQERQLEQWAAEDAAAESTEKAPPAEGGAGGAGGPREAPGDTVQKSPDIGASPSEPTF